MNCHLVNHDNEAAPVIDYTLGTIRKNIIFTYTVHVRKLQGRKRTGLLTAQANDKLFRHRGVGVSSMSTWTSKIRGGENFPGI